MRQNSEKTFGHKARQKCILPRKKDENIENSEGTQVFKRNVRFGKKTLRLLSVRIFLRKVIEETEEILWRLIDENHPVVKN